MVFERLCGLRRPLKTTAVFLLVNLPEAVNLIDKKEIVLSSSPQCHNSREKQVDLPEWVDHTLHISNSGSHHYTIEFRFTPLHNLLHIKIQTCTGFVIGLALTSSF